MDKQESDHGEEQQRKTSEDEREKSQAVVLDEPDGLRQFVACDSCGAPNPPKRCSRCRLTFYCSVECQKQHWRASHKPDCVPIDIMRGRLAGIGAGPLLDKEATVFPVNSSCGICLEDPIQQPVVLPQCKHAFLFCLSKRVANLPTTGDFVLPENHSLKRKTNKSCPYCRQEIGKSVVEEALEKAGMYAARAGVLKNVNDQAEKHKLYDMAISQVDKILATDDSDMQALCLKGQILKDFAPHESIQVFEKVLALDEEGRINSEKLVDMLDEAEIPIDAGNDDEAERLMDAIDNFQNSGANFIRIGSGPRRLFQLKISLAEAHEAAGHWTHARDLYVTMLKEVMTEDDPKNEDAPTTRMLCSGSSRCWYHLGFYDRAIAGGEMALAMNRHFPGVHKLIALPQLALGDCQAALTTMRRGVVYETPWDDNNRHENIRFLNELLLRNQDCKVDAGEHDHEYT